MEHTEATGKGYRRGKNHTPDSQRKRLLHPTASQDGRCVKAAGCRHLVDRPRARAALAPEKLPMGAKCPSPPSPASNLSVSKELSMQWDSNNLYGRTATNEVQIKNHSIMPSTEPSGANTLYTQRGRDPRDLQCYPFTCWMVRQGLRGYVAGQPHSKGQAQTHSSPSLPSMPLAMSSSRPFPRRLEQGACYKIIPPSSPRQRHQIARVPPRKPWGRGQRQRHP